MAITPTGPSAEGRQRALHVSHRPRSSALHATSRVAGSAIGILIISAWPAFALGQTTPGAAYALPSPLENTSEPNASTTTRRHPVEFHLAAQETLTDNVNLLPSGFRTSDLVTRIAPGMSVHYVTPRVRLEGDVDLSVLLYARTGGQNDRIQPKVNLFGRLEAIENLLFLEASALVTQTYFNAFGPTSAAIENNPQNAYTSYTYRVTPELLYRTGDYRYELRDNNIWTNVNSAPSATNNAYTNELSASVQRTPTPLGWSVDYRRNDVQFADNQSQLVEIWRASGLLRPNRAAELSASFGYENDRFATTSDHGAIYGVAAKWHPNNRLRFEASWEHRVFGPSYLVKLENRTPLMVWSVEAGRQITSFPELLARLPAGDVASLLDTLFTSRFPDPAERQQFVQQFVDARGLPQTLADPLALYSREIHVEQHVSASVGLIGARNTVFFRAYRSRAQPVAGNESADALFSQTLNTTQEGASISWTHRLQPRVRLSVSYYPRYVKSEVTDAKARETSLNALLSVVVSTRTSAFGGLRFQRLRSNSTAGYDEAAVFAGVNYSFN